MTPLHAPPWPSQPLALAGVVLCLSYAVIAAVDLLPPQLLDPAWLTRVCLTLTRWAFLPLLGTVLVHLAASGDPEDGLLKQRLVFRRSAVAACAGLLLLIPLQGLAVWRALDLSNANARAARENALLRFERLRRTTETASSAAALQEGLLALQGPVLPAAAMRLPLPMLRRQVLLELRMAEVQVSRRLTSLAWQRALWPGLHDLALVSGLAVLNAMAFSAFAQAGRAEISLLEEMQQAMWTGGRRHRHSPEEAAYLAGISAEDAVEPDPHSQSRD